MQLRQAPFPLPADAQMQISLSKKSKFWATVHTNLSVFCLDLIVLALKSTCEGIGHAKEENVFHFCDFSIRGLNLKEKKKRKKKTPQAKTLVSFAKCKNSCESPEAGVLCGLHAVLMP